MASNFLKLGISSVLGSILLSACVVYEPSKKFDLENERRIRELWTKRDFVSPEERNAIDSEIKFREIKRDGLVIPDGIYFASDSDTNNPVSTPLDGKEEKFNQQLDNQLHRLNNMSEKLLKWPPSKPLEPIR